MFYDLKLFLIAGILLTIFFVSMKNENLNKNPFWYFLTIGSVFLIAYLK